MSHDAAAEKELTKAGFVTDTLTVHSGKMRWAVLVCFFISLFISYEEMIQDFCKLYGVDTFLCLFY